MISSELFNLADFDLFIASNWDFSYLELDIKNNSFQMNWLLLIYYFRFHINSDFNLFINIQANNDLINNLESLYLSNNIENITAIYHYSIPNTKLFYPEPFIASASFMHSDLWFVHILIYQYWLWFVFIFLIVFFFLTFLTVIRWCNMRTRPRRETRGVSRSKCGDLITACVPVSWATSIIVNESTDAIDFYDGFGTTELVVGIRAYQWGWEYYYPKDIDLNYNIKKNYSTFVGNSLKYNSTSSDNLKMNNLWKFYQNKIFDATVTPAHLLLLTTDFNKILNFTNFNDIGASSFVEAASFKKNKIFFKFNSWRLFYNLNFFNDKYKNFYKIYSNDMNFYNSNFYGIRRQHNFLTSFQNNKITNLNSKNITKFIKYNCNDDLNNYEFFFKQNLNFIKYFYFKNNNNFNNYLNKFFTDFNQKKIINKLNLSIDLNETFFKKNISIAPNSKKINLLTNWSLLNTYKNSFYNSSFSNVFFFFNISKTNWTNLENFYKSSNYKLQATHSFTPSNSNNFKWAFFDYTNIENEIENDSNQFIFSEKEQFMPSNLSSLFLNFFWLQTSNSLKLYNNIKYFNSLNTIYLPMFTLYYDYDFRNYQSIELLEDAIWDHMYNNSIFDEYLNMFQYFYYNVYNDKKLNCFNEFHRFTEKFEDDLINLNVLDDFSNMNYFYTNYFFLEEFMPNLTYLNSNNLNLYNTIIQINGLDDTYENLKFLTNFSNAYDKIFLKLNTNHYAPYSYSVVFDFFRSNHEETNWFFDENTTSNWYLNNDVDYLDINKFKNFRINNNLNLRNTVKNSIINYNAIQKVFKARFDDSRSHSKISEFSNYWSKQPYLNANRISYEKLLGKNKINFFKINNYKLINYENFNFYYNINTFLNFSFFDFPFLLGMKSDSSKHFWIDWFAKWSYVEVQPASTSKYGIHGMFYLNKFFDFNLKNNETLNETESYFTRISRARRNYIPNWTYSPYFYLRHNQWFVNTLFSEMLCEIDENIILTKINLNNSKKFWNCLAYQKDENYLFAPSISNVNSYAKSTWRPFNSIAAYYYNSANLIDILTKREYLYRQLLLNNNKIINLPIELTNNLQNPLIHDLKSSFGFVDQISFNNEYSKDLHFNSLNFFNFNIFKTFLKSINFFNTNNIIDDVFFYFFQKDLKYNNINNELYKNQYRPLKKGVNNMLRLHASNAIAMPIEIRLQILASSKDVIHSWAVPSAGVKIDCVPGYSSHKVIIFLVSGIFWGQCMEICGRYHHWMPIVVYFMKRDLFFLWCSHFVFSSNSNNIWNLNDRQYWNYTKTVSFDKFSWLNEITK